MFDTGQRLGSQFRRQLEDGFQHDLSGIRIHADPLSARIARAAGARGFALGPHVFIDPAAMNPAARRRLVAHEICHSLQQRLAGSVSAPLHAFGPADDGHEQEAWHASAQVVRGNPAPSLTPDASGLWRRAVTIAPNSAQLHITVRPTVQPPVITPPSANFNCTSIQAAGEVTLNGGAGDSATGWTLGFIQAQWIETNWGYYRGQHNSDGSVFVQRGRPPARPAQGCRDTVGPVTDIFYNTMVLGTAAAGATFPVKLMSTHYDLPSDSYALAITNNKTGKLNFLREAQLEFHFCFILTLRDPAKNFHHLKCIYWNVLWQAEFSLTGFAAPSGSGWTQSLVAGGNSANVGHVIDGAPTDRRFTGVITSAQGANCNGFAASETGHPNIREARVWENFDVTR